MSKENFVPSIAFTKDLIISGNRKMIKIGQINGFGMGDFQYTNLYPAVSCIVKKNNNKYDLLNENDLRVKKLLEQYDQSTLVEVFEISSQRDADKIRFLTGDLIPHQTTTTEFKDLFSKIVMNNQYQKWVNTHFTVKQSRANSQVSFNLQNFIQILGINAPSKPTLDRIIKEVKNIKDGTPPPPISTPPTQIEVHKPPENPQAQQSIETNIQAIIEAQAETIPQYINDKQPSEPPPDFQPSIEIVESNSLHGLSDNEMREVWDTYSNGKYSYLEVRKLLNDKESTRFTKRLNSIEPNNPDSLKFVQSLEQLLDEKSSHE